VASPKK